MPETDVDRRAGTIVLVTHGLLNALPGAPDDRAHVAAAVLAWADTHDYALYQLPPAAHHLVPHADAQTGERLAAEDAADLDFVFSQLATYRANGYRIAGLVLSADDLASEIDRDTTKDEAASASGNAEVALLDARRVWRDALARAAAAHDVPLEPQYVAEQVVALDPRAAT